VLFAEFQDHVRTAPGEIIDLGGDLCRKFPIMFGETPVLTPLLENGQSSKSLVHQISIFDALSV